MRKGDLVRFTNPGLEAGTYKSLGLLLEYESWQKIAVVLFDGKILRLHARDVTKAGKKDCKNSAF